MTQITRTASARWTGNLREGRGTVSTASGALSEMHYSFKTRFEQSAGTNPEELLAAAHAGCFTMAFSGVLQRAGYESRMLATEAICQMEKTAEGFRISAMHLKVRGSAEGLEQADFQRLAEEAEQGCPISGALRGNMTIDVEARLEEPSLAG